MKNLVLRYQLAIIAASVVCLWSTLVQAQIPNTEVLNEAREISSMVSAVLGEFTSGRDADAHKAILDKALAVAVFPNVRRTTLYVYSRTRGSGIVTRRTREGWSAPAFYRVNRGRWDFGFGTSRNDLIVFFLNEDAVNQLFKRQFRLGSNATKDMISYSQADGFNAGLKLQGAAVRPNDALTTAVSGGKGRLEVLFTQPKEALAIAEKNGTDTVRTKLASISPATAQTGIVRVALKVANKSKTYYVYFHESGPKFAIEPRTSGLVVDGIIKADPPVEQWTPQLTTVPDKDSDWNVEELPKGAFYHFVCVEQKDRYKELLLDQSCLNDCEITCSDVSPPRTTNQAQESKQQKGGRPKRKKR